MRVTPTVEQLNYLVSIGVSPHTLPQPMSVPANSNNSKRLQPPQRHSWHQALKWWTILAVTLAFLIAVHAANGKELPSPRPTVPSAASTKTESEVSHPQLADLVQQLAELKEALATQQTATATAIEEKFAHLSDRLAEPLTVLEAGIRQTKQALERQVQGAVEERTVLFRTAGFALLGVAALFIVQSLNVMFSMKRALGRVETHLVRRLDEHGANGHSVPPALESPVQEPRHTLVSREDVQEDTGELQSVAAQAQRPTAAPLLPPATQMAHLVEAAKNLNLAALPELPQGPWNLGLATDRGHVRSENQDYGLCFRIRSHQVLIVADGCGGIPRGQRAAQLSVQAAAQSIIRAYGQASTLRMPAPAKAAAQAMHDAAHCLAVEGDKLNIADIRDGLRTTLLSGY